MTKSHRSSLRRQLPHYAAAATAASIAAPGLSGAIVHVTTPVILIAPNTGVTWDINGDSVNDFGFQNVDTGAGTMKFEGYQAGNNFVKNTGSSGFRITKLTPGFGIGPTMVGKNFATAGYNGGSLTQAGHAVGGLIFGTQEVGFRFNISGQIHYGWADITLASQALIIDDWAYESTANTPITAGAVPEPAQSTTGLGLLALGAAGVAAYKRRKAQKAA